MPLSGPIPPDVRARQRRELALALTLRTLAAVGLVAAAGFMDTVDGTELRRLGYWLAFGWLPCTAVLDLARRDDRSRGLRLLSGVAEFMGFAVAALAIPELAGVALVLLAVAAGGHLLGTDLRVGFETAGTAAGAAVLVIAVPEPRADNASLMLFGGVLAMILVIAFASAEDRTRVSSGLARVHRRSDAILQGVGESVVVTSPRGRIRQWNDAAEMTFDCPREHAIGMTCEQVLGLRRDVAQLDCRGGCPLVDEGDQQVWRSLSNGRRQPLLVVASAVTDADGEITEVVHSMRDVTALKQADEAKTMFLATASHELKTPLAVIQGFSAVLLESDELPDAQRNALDAIHRRAEDLSGIVERLLMSSRIEAGRVRLEPVYLDAVPLVEERANAMRDARQVDIVLRVEPGIAPVVGDQDAIHTVVDHLLDNAVKYSPDGGQVVVEISQVGDHVEITVEDSGIGMTESERNQCFDRFWQAEGTDVRRFGGTGIGLYIVRALVEAMYGEVGVESEPGVGSRFRVALAVAGTERGAASADDVVDTEVPAQPEPSIIKEFMRQVGVGGAG